MCLRFSKLMIGCLSRSLCLVLAAALFSISPLNALASDKKGVGLANLHAADRILALDVAWYYTWSPQPIEGVPANKFVPMLWGGRRFDQNLSELRGIGKVPVLLAVNEPDRPDQANVSVEEVIRQWSQIEPLAKRISSPAPAGVLGPWFDKFHRMATARGLRYDFMAVHLYGPPDPTKFLAKIDAVHAKYGMPIWITEFAVADWDATDKPGSNRYSEDQVLAFMKTVLPELEKRPFVERYAWFGAGRHSLSHEQVRTSRLFEKDGRLTKLGCFYANFNESASKKLPQANCENAHVQP